MQEPLKKPKTPSKKESPSICVECGICCSGAMFEDVELKNEHEATSMEAIGLEIEEEDGKHLLIQPCAALRSTKCTIYPHRPDCCRTFECHLLKNLHAGKINRRKALDLIQKVQRLISGQKTEHARPIIEKHFLDWRS